MDAPTTLEQLSEWLRDLKEASGLSYAQIGGAIDEDPRNVKRWMPEKGVPVEPRGLILLKLLTAFGVEFTPPPPDAVRALDGHVKEVRSLLAEVEQRLAAAQAAEKDAPRSVAHRLRGLEAKVDGMALATAESLGKMASAIDDLSARLPEAGRDNPRSGAQGGR